MSASGEFALKTFVSVRGKNKRQSCFLSYRPPPIAVVTEILLIYKRKSDIAVPHIPVTKVTYL